MSNVDIRQTLDPLLKQLEEEKSIDVAEKIISELVGLLGIKVSDRFLLNVPRIDAELSRFMLAPGFGRQAAAYDIPNDHPELMDLKLFWIKKTTKTNLSWLIGITPNFEDSDANDYKNISIDFIFPESADRLIILISDKFKIRSLELKDHVTHTQFEIFSNWQNVKINEQKDLQEAKRFIHSRLWESFNFEPINRAFYLELVESFSLLVHHLEQTFGRKPSVMFTTRLIGRLLFLWFLKKKRFLNESYEYFLVSNPLEQTEYYKNKLEVLFFDVLNKEISERINGDAITPYLNGGLFDTNQTDFYCDESLTFPPGFFSNLFETLNKYNFTVDESSPEFQHVAIDPEMLGRIFESLLSEQIDEESGDNKRKITGAFYTPREVVSFMCEESLIQHLKNKLPDLPDRNQRIEELVRLPETIFRDQDSNKRQGWKSYVGPVISALSGTDGKDYLTILDPAVGSGAFPMGMLHLLVKVYGRLDVKYEKNISDLKREILSKSLYGVDIEQTAIEICRLRAWLSIIVDISDVGAVQPLPNLDFKFTCANTLIPLDDDRQATLLTDYSLKDKLMAIRDEYFNTSNKKKKTKLQKEYFDLTHSEDLFDSERTKQLKSYKPFDSSASSDFYDPDLHHGVKYFDLVIGNPPYIQLQKDKGRLSKIYQKYGYESFSSTGDIYCLFYEVGNKFLKDGGFLAFITSNKWLRAKYGENLRGYLSKNTSPTVLIDLGSGVFETATVDTNILIFQKGKPFGFCGCAEFKRGSNIENLSIEKYIRQSALTIKKFDHQPWVMMNELEARVVEKANTVGQKLDDWSVYINKGLMTGFNDAYYIDEKTKVDLVAHDPNSIDLIRPLLRGREIKKYFTHVSGDSYVLVISDRTKINDYPAVKKHLLAFKDKLEERAQFIRGDHPWFSVDNCPSEKMLNLFDKRKIIYPNMSQMPYMTIDDLGAMSNDKTFILASEDEDNIFYIAGILNSKIGQFLIKKFCPTLGETGFELRKIFFSQIPVPIPSAQVKSAFVKLVMKAYGLRKKVNPNTNLSNEDPLVLLEKELDLMAYKIYTLNQDEIEFIDNF